MISIRALLPQSVELSWRMYLATYAQHFRASGLTFIDDAVTEFFPPHAVGKRVMLLLALGKKAQRKWSL